MKTLLSATLISLASATVSFADTCPDWDLPNAADQARFCKILQEILHAPHEPQPALRGLFGQGDLPESIQTLIDSQPLMTEAYNSNSKRTLELIRMIQDAGGAGSQ